MVYRKAFIPRLLFTFSFFAAIFFASCATKSTSDPVPAPASEPRPPPAIVTVEAPPELIEPLIEMISIPGGTFEMGSPAGKGRQDNEYPGHSVTIRSFLLGKYEVTQSEYFEVTGVKPSRYTYNPDDNSEDGWKKLPVEWVNWYETIVFCNKLSMKEFLKPVFRIKGSTNPADWGEIPPSYINDNGNKIWLDMTDSQKARIITNKNEWDKVEMISGADGYRLPTEAEWEYAARGGGSSNFNFSGSNSINDVAWWYNNSRATLNNSYIYIPREVGKKLPNKSGLYDMSGNVMEWCWDWLAGYTSSHENDPVGPSTSPYTAQPQRIIRGGSFSYGEDHCRVTYRYNNEPFSRQVNLGFRVARWE